MFYLTLQKLPLSAMLIQNNVGGGKCEGNELLSGAKLAWT